MDELFVSLHCFKFDSFEDAAGKKELFHKINGIAEELSKKGVFVCRQFFSIKYNADLILFNIAGSYELLFSFKDELAAVSNKVLTETYSYFSVYEHPNAGYLKEDSETKYLVAYPVKKDPAWYLLDKNEQERITKEHVNMAVNDPNNSKIRSYTTYSFAVDDFEFLVLYEVASLPEWMRVARNLRNAEARKWITVESPVFIGEKAGLLID
jgi:chlorite dismutase